MTVHRPFLKSAARHAMGIKALDPVDWITFGEDAAHQLAERRRLLEERPGDVLAALPGSESAQEELLALLLEHLALHASDRYGIEGGTAVELATGLRCPRSGASPPPLGHAGWLVQEDFCLMEKPGDRYILSAAVLCFPAHWSLAEKIGRPLVEIHAPVPGYAEKLGSPVERLFDRLEPERPVQRMNWSLVDTAELFLPPSHRTRPADIEPDRAGDQLRLRVERQTFRRLPKSRAVVFGIRTYINPLCDAVGAPEHADALIERLHELPDPMLGYKNLKACRPALLTYLERQRAERI